MPLDPESIIKKCPTPLPTDKDRMDWVSQYSYAEKLCSTYKTILSHIGRPSKNFQGRANEVDSVKESLLKKRMRNCVLIGSAGVGKTEIIKAAISSLSTNDIFLDMDLASMISGCTLVGMFEQRFTDVVRAVAQANRTHKAQICFFVDEVHNLFRVGKSDQYGTMSGGEILKPYLSEGSITLIGATTYEEYEKYVKADKALLRRLPPLFVKGMGDEEVAKIVYGFFEKKIPMAICREIVKKSHEIDYLNNPDCSLEIADRAMAKSKLYGETVSLGMIDGIMELMKGGENA